MLEQIIKELPEDKQYKASEVAQIFLVTTETVREWVKMGWLDYEIKLNEYRFSKRNIWEFYLKRSGHA